MECSPTPFIFLIKTEIPYLLQCHIWEDAILAILETAGEKMNNAENWFSCDEFIIHGPLPFPGFVSGPKALQLKGHVLLARHVSADADAKLAYSLATTTKYNANSTSSASSMLVSMRKIFLKAN